MSSTRHASPGSAVSFERYMSSPEFAQLRGIPGTAVAAKAQLYTDARKRSLLFFIQSLSLRAGGLKQAAQAIRPSTFGEKDAIRFLIELCINPKVVMNFSREANAASDLTSRFDALREFQHRYEAKLRSDFVLTTIGREIFDTLDHALAIQKMVVIEGESGSGKTTAAEAWCAQHQGEARFVTLSGITHKTGFFRKLGSAIGLATARSKAIDMQVRVEDFFRKTRLMLVIDEAHYLWPQYQRSYTSPELIDWVNTALVNQNVPVALICTHQFAKLKSRVEKLTGWTSEQLEHRVKRYKKLTAIPTKKDLEAVAAELLGWRWNPREQRWNVSGPPPNPDLVRVVLGYALTCKMRLPAVATTVEEARYQARKANRSHIVAMDIRTALLDYQIPSDEGLQRAFQTDRPKPAIALPFGHSSNSATPLQSHCNRVAAIVR
jgi:hypothetical protein